MVEPEDPIKKRRRKKKEEFLYKHDYESMSEEMRISQEKKILRRFKYLFFAALFAIYFTGYILGDVLRELVLFIYFGNGPVIYSASSPISQSAGMWIGIINIFKWIFMALAIGGVYFYLKSKMPKPNESKEKDILESI